MAETNCTHSSDRSPPEVARMVEGRSDKKATHTCQTEGQEPSLKVEFELGKSMYATMLMRELTKKNM